MKKISAIIVSLAVSGVAAANDYSSIEDITNNVMMDASSRSTLFANDLPATLNVGGFLQTRYSYSSGSDTDANYGFSVPRVRIILSGSVYNWNYKVSGQWSEGSDFSLKDAWASSDFESVNFKFGQFKTPFMKEVLVSQTNILGIERSVVSSTFGQGRSQGVQLSHDFGPLTASAAYSDGFDTANGAGVQNGYAATGRLDWDLFDWLNLGTAISYNQQDVTYWTWTADAGISVGDLTLDGAYVSAEYDNGRQWGATGQLGYHITKELQPYVEYQYGELDTTSEQLSIITGGFNYFFNANVKLGADFGYALNGIAAGWNTGETGWNVSTSSGEYLARVQLQLEF